VLEDQHDAIHDRLALAAKAAQSWRPAAPAGPRDILAKAVEHLLAITRDHLALEEEHVVPLIKIQSTDSLLAAGSGLISGLSAVIAPLSQLASVASGDKDP
jgi:hypothetical protein